MANETGALVAQLKQRQPLNIVPVAELFPEGKRVGLVIVDQVNGFCTPGCGPLAPPVEDAMIEKMVSETDRLARLFVDRDMPILILQEAHTANRPEPPYPPHCIKGSGDELLVPKLNWIYEYQNARLIEKSCINGVIGAIEIDDSNQAFDWINGECLDMIIVAGICTDICVLQYVQAMLSARNRDLVNQSLAVVVYTEGCSTYDLPIEVARQIKLPEFLAHDQEIAHYTGLYLMQMSGAILVESFN